jgi:hypothetical protein
MSDYTSGTLQLLDLDFTFYARKLSLTILSYCFSRVGSVWP